MVNEGSEVNIQSKIKYVFSSAEVVWKRSHDIFCSQINELKKTKCKTIWNSVA